MNKFAASLLFAFGVSVAVADETPPDQMIHSVVDQMRALITKNRAAYKADKPGYYKVVDQVLVPHFDGQWIAQAVLGRANRTATADQKARFQAAFQDMLVHSYADELLDSDETDSDKITYQPPRFDDPDDANVDTILTRVTGKPPATITFTVHQANGEWKVRDIKVEGIDLVINFRAQITDQIKQTSLDDVITKMQSGVKVIAKPDTNAPAGAKPAGASK